MADAERKQEAVETDPAPRIDRAEQVLDRSGAKALAVIEFVGIGLAAVPGFQSEDVGGTLDQLLGEEQLDLLLAQPLDVERIARDEVQIGRASCRERVCLAV